ncbi:MAG: 4-hydroxythreonine-4-phosphate dehydrogenase PdxA [Bosea sp. (in: a-proteobacteria)]
MKTTLLALTEGDPAGIGPELALKAWLLREREGLSPFAVFGSVARLRARAKLLKLDVPLVACSIVQARATFPDALPVIETGHDQPSFPGQPDPATAAGTIASIRQAVAAVQAGHCAAVVTNPIAKSVLYAAGFRHPGHTEFLAELAATDGAPAPHPVMMIWSDLLAVVPVTIHIPLKDVPSQLTTQLIVQTGRIVARDLKKRFGLANPRLALAGLNPHAGENGTMGREDAKVIAPAVAQLRAEGIDAIGPWPADTMFHARARQSFDVALGMYHDQVLIPAKTLAFDEGVNVTLGLPFIRTSPDHGTAFDIAAKGIARPDSLCAALRLAARLASQPKVL